ncbi:MAG: beta-ketoacyl synthase N-terminal-like domain-containing protein [Ruminococcus sp.]
MIEHEGKNCSDRDELPASGGGNAGTAALEFGAKKVSVRDVSDARKQLASGAVPDALQLAAVEDLALFDNSFFEISNREARAMCPEARLSLTHAAKAILDAGYARSRHFGEASAVSLFRRAIPTISWERRSGTALPLPEIFRR